MKQAMIISFTISFLILCSVAYFQKAVYLGLAAAFAWCIIGCLFLGKMMKKSSYVEEEKEQKHVDTECDWHPDQMF